jgi:hypothetical protein
MYHIHKFRLEEQREQEILLPVGSRILTLQLQDDMPHIWCMVSQDKDMETRTFTTCLTGWQVDDKLSAYIGTYQKCGLVYHVFETGERY